MLSYLYAPSNSTAQVSGPESSQTSQMPIGGAGNLSASPSYYPVLHPSHSEILSSNFSATNEAEYIEQCDSAVPQSMEKTIQSQADNATVSPYFKTHEISNFDILGRLVIQYPNNWGVSNNSLGYPQFYTLDDPYTFLYVNVDISPIKNLSLNNYLNYTIESLDEQGLGFKLNRSTTDAKLIGNDAYLLEYEQQHQENPGVMLRKMETGVIIGDRVFYILYTTEKTIYYSQYLPTVQKMINSINIERFYSYESLDLGIRFLYPPSWNKTYEDESTVSFEGSRQDKMLSSLEILRVPGIVEPIEVFQYINQLYAEYNELGYNPTEPTAIYLQNSPNSEGYFFEYYMNNTDSVIKAHKVIATQNNVAYEITYEVAPTDYGDSYFDGFQTTSISSQHGMETEEDYNSYFDEFLALLDSAQIFDAKRYEKGFYNNLAGIILEYPNLHPYFSGDLSPNEVSSIMVNFTKANPSSGQAFFDLEVSVKPLNLLDEDKELANELKILNNEIPDSNICKVQVANNLGQENATTFYKINFVYTSGENQNRKGLLFYGVYNNFSYLFNFTADRYHYDLLLPTVEEIYDSLKIVASKHFAQGPSSKHQLISGIVYPRIWQFVPQAAGFQITSPRENLTDNFIEYLFLNVGAQGLNSLQDVVSDYIAGLKEQTTNFQLIDAQESILSNNTAHKIVYTYSEYSCECDVKEMVIFTIRDKKVYTLTFSAEMDKFISYLPTIESILDSIKIQEKSLANTTGKSGLQLNGSPVDLAINPITNRLYVAIPDARQIQVIDGFTDRLIANITLGANPNAVVLNQYTNKIYVASPETDMIYVIDGFTNNITARIQAGPIVGDIAVDTNEFARSGTLVFVSNTGNDSLSIIEDTKGRVVENIETGPHPFGVGVDSIKNRAYITTDIGVDIFDYGPILAERDVVATHLESINAGYIPLGIVVNSNTSKAYMANSGVSTVSVIDTLSNSHLYEIEAGVFPHALAFNPTDRKLYVASSGNNMVSVIDTTERMTVNSTVRNITTDSIPYDVAINPNTNMIYLANYESKTLSTINSAASMPMPVAALTFHINPANAGHIKCEENGKEKEIPEDSYQRITLDTHCKAIANNGYVFRSWSNGEQDSSFTVSQYGAYTANFSTSFEIIQGLSPVISVGGLVLVVLLAAIKPMLHIGKNTKKEREEKSKKNVPGTPNLPIAYRTESIEKEEKEKREQKDGMEEDYNLLSKAEIIGVDTAIIAAVLVFVTLAEGFDVGELTQITVIAATVIFPFAISAIIAATNREKFAIRLMIAGFINLMIAVILIAIMKF